MFGVSQINKLFGDIMYDQSISQESFDYNVVSFQDSVGKSEEK